MTHAPAPVAAPSELADDLRELIDTVRSLYSTSVGPITGKVHRYGRLLPNASAAKIDLRGLSERVRRGANVAGLGHLFGERRGWWGRCRLPAVELPEGVQFVVYSDSRVNVLEEWLAVAEHLLSEVENSIPETDPAPAPNEPLPVWGPFVIANLNPFTAFTAPDPVLNDLTPALALSVPVGTLRALDEPPDTSTGRKTTRPRRVDKKELECLVRAYLEARKDDPAAVRIKEVAKTLGYAVGTIHQTNAWLAFEARRNALSAKTVRDCSALTPEMLAILENSTAIDPAELAAAKEQEEQELAELIREQAADREKDERVVCRSRRSPPRS